MNAPLKVGQVIFGMSKVVGSMNECLPTEQRAFTLSIPVRIWYLRQAKLNQKKRRIYLRLSRGSCDAKCLSIGRPLQEGMHIMVSNYERPKHFH